MRATVRSCHRVERGHEEDQFVATPEDAHELETLELVQPAPTISLCPQRGSARLSRCY